MQQVTNDNQWLTFQIYKKHGDYVQVCHIIVTHYRLYFFRIEQFASIQQGQKSLLFHSP